jgi:hypothetical protein
VRSLVLAAAGAALMLGAVAPSATADTRFERIAGFQAPGTPAKFNRVGVLKVGPSRAKNVLVLNPGTSASAAYFAPLAKDVVRRAKDWQVWAVERRENLLEDQSVVDQAKAGRATDERLFDYYLGYLTKPSVTDHARMIPDSEVPFARQWGMRVEIEDVRRVVRAAKRLGGRSLWAVTRSEAPLRPPMQPGTSAGRPAPRASPASSPRPASDAAGTGPGN